MELDWPPAPEVLLMTTIGPWSGGDPVKVTTPLSRLIHTGTSSNTPELLYRCRRKSEPPEEPDSAVPSPKAICHRIEVAVCPWIAAAIPPAVLLIAKVASLAPWVPVNVTVPLSRLIQNGASISVPALLYRLTLKSEPPAEPDSPKTSPRDSCHRATPAVCP